MKPLNVFHKSSPAATLDTSNIPLEDSNIPLEVSSIPLEISIFDDNSKITKHYDKAPDGKPFLHYFILENLFIINR